MKKIEKSIDSLKKEIKERKSILAEMQKQLSEKDKELQSLLKFLHREITVSDHSIVRYCERKLNIDIESIKQAITEKHTQAIRMMGGNGTINDDNIKYVVQNYTIVTII